MQVLFTDEGVNGLSLHAVNETAAGLDVEVEVKALRDGRLPVVSGRRDLSLAPRASVEIACTDLFGAFFDTNYAYRFGPPSHDAVVASLISGGRTLAQAFHFPLGRSRALHRGQLSATLERGEDGWSLHVAADCLQQSVHIAVDGFDPSDDWFHLPPGATREIRLAPHGADGEAPSGEVRSLSGSSVRF